MSKRESAFEGHRQIAGVVERIRPLAQWMEANRPQAREASLTLRRRDYELLVRWPQAASLHQIWFDHGGIPHWGRFTLRADGSESEHKGRSKQVQL